MARTRALVHPALLSSLALSLALVGGCKSKTDDAASTGAADSSPDKAADEGGASAGADSAGSAESADSGAVAGDESGAPGPVVDEEPDDPRAAAIEITKSSAASSVSAKGAKGLGFSIEKISHLFALKATAKVPEWGARGEGEAKLTRDDDLDTAWRCEFGGDAPCVLGLALPEKAKVEVLRLYTATGPRYRDYKGHPHVARVRVHTDAGFVEADLPEGANHAYVRFAAPVETQSLAIEVLGVHEGNKDKQIHLAEVEVYGTEGVPRPPITLDPSLAWVGWETTTWGGADLDHKIRQLFVYFARDGEDGEDGPPRRRFARATAVFGQLGDDYALFERLYGTKCEGASGNYMLFDKRNRMYYALGELGGAGAEVYRHAAGRGFAVGWMNDEGQFTVKGVVEEGGKLKWKRPPKAGVADGRAQLSAWGFDPDPLDRGVEHGGAVAGCHRGGAGELEPVIAAAKLATGGELDPAAWMICSVGGDTLYASAPCGGHARAYQLDGAGKLIGEHESKDADARGLRLRRSGDQLFVELSSKQGDSSSLYLAEPGRLVELERNGGLAVRPPSTCGVCEDAWLNPEAPASEGGSEEDSVDEGAEPEPEPGADEAPEADEARPLPPPAPAPPG
ncbi:hypothetical protein ENSA5_38240 [Enhygromyxa salina]|uniref:F5/8 type C domain protein n=1 Tax=Enhygromyxa salina TaxID=215803 RepID=A0A2S9XS58_9BACT|nr:hypothetical protein [Enhygromyxa salina]PRP95541.1 hypothetical protein ENSA5_38240 [Enhygromyxa salina]